MPHEVRFSPLFYCLPNLCPYFYYLIQICCISPRSMFMLQMPIFACTLNGNLNYIL